MEIEVTVNNPTGLHSRPATKLVNTATQFKSEIKIFNGEKEANAKRIISLLKLGASKGCKVRILAEGEDEQKAIEAIEELFLSNFGE